MEKEKKIIENISRKNNKEFIERIKEIEKFINNNIILLNDHIEFDKR